MLKENLLKFLKLDSLIEHLTGYVEARIDLVRIEIKEELSQGLSKAVVYLLILTVLMLSILLASMAVAFKIGESLGYFAGFGMVGGFYLVLGIAAYLLRNQLAAKIEERLNERMNKKHK